jgi:hypothetical protein
MWLQRMIPLISGQQSGGSSGGGGTGGGGEAAAFLARTTGLDATHTNAYTALINGLAADGLWSKFDALYVFATQDSATALLNLVSTNFSATTAGGTLTFTADRGFTAGAGNGTLTTGFNPTTAPSPNFVQNSAHASAWSVTDPGTSAIAIFGGIGGIETDIYPKYTDNNAYFRANSSNIAGVAVADPIGHYVANRSSSSAVQGYKNGSSILSNGSATSGAPANRTFTFGAIGTGGGVGPCPNQIAAASIGSSLSSTDATNFYNRLRTYMTAVGVP